MSIKDLTETELDSQTVYRGNLLQAKRDTVRLASGRQSEREYIVHPGAVLVVPVLADGRLVFERQFRYPLRRTFIELPAGKIDPNEDPLETGKRELKEETGYSAAHWQYLATLHPCIGYSDERIVLYLATGLTAGEHNRDLDESLEVFTWSLDQAMTAMRAGEITDGKTMVALFWAEKVLRGGWSSESALFNSGKPLNP